MQKHGLILEKQTSPHVYVEFGAGRAGLSSFVAARLLSHDNKVNVFVAIDRDARKFKLDKEFKDHMLSFRERLDIADIDLKTFLEKKGEQIGPSYHIVAIAKHLCGGATDLALTSMGLQEKEKALGVTIATCCHHVCDAKTYVNLPYLRENFDEQDIMILPRFSSWAISPQMSTESRRLGFKTKRILDYGRCLFIEKTLGMTVTPYQYCDPLKESPENILLVAGQ